MISTSQPVPGCRYSHSVLAEPPCGFSVTLDNCQHLSRVTDNFFFFFETISVDGWFQGSCGSAKKNTSDKQNFNWAGPPPSRPFGFPELKSLSALKILDPGQLQPIELLVHVLLLLTHIDRIGH